jgi:hypothetical protein
MKGSKQGELELFEENAIIPDLPSFLKESQKRVTGN